MDFCSPYEIAKPETLISLRDWLKLLARLGNPARPASYPPSLLSSRSTTPPLRAFFRHY